MPYNAQDAEKYYSMAPILHRLEKRMVIIGLIAFVIALWVSVALYRQSNRRWGENP